MTRPLLPGKSLLNMAEAMILDQEYKFSHSNLKEWGDETEREENEKSSRERVDHDLKTPDENDEVPDNTKHEERRPEGRSVVIQVPPKRRKISNPYTPTDVVSALYSAVSEVDRQEAIYKALNTFDHDDQALHDSEIEAGADIALLKMLAFLEFKTGFRREPIVADMDAITREISLTCQALEMVYRAGSRAVGTSFQRIGTDLLHILVILIDDEVKNRVRAFTPDTSPSCGSMDGSLSGNQKLDDSPDDRPGSRSITPPPGYGNAWNVGSYDRDLMLKKASKILGHYARVGHATKAIAHFPGLLGSVLNLINMRPYDAVPWEARLSCLWTIANLACDSANMTMMMCTPGLMNSLINVGFRQIETSDPIERIMEILRARSIASRAILNLSWPAENKIPMAEDAALIRVLCQLAIQRRPPFVKSKTMQDIMVQTRRHSIGAIRNLAAAPRRSKIALANYNNGKLFDVLTDAALNDNDQRVIDLSFAAIHNLAIHDTAEMIVDRPALVLALKNSLSDESTNEPGNTIKDHASSTLLVLERSITPEMPSYENLRELLDAINPSNPSEEEVNENDAIKDERSEDEASEHSDQIRTAAV